MSMIGTHWNAHGTGRLALICVALCLVLLGFNLPVYSASSDSLIGKVNGKFRATDSRAMTSSDTTAFDPLDRWLVRSPFPPQGTINAVTYGSGTFVAVGCDDGELGYVPRSIVLTSTDGATWTQRTSPVATWGSLYGVTYGNGTFVAVGGFDNTSTSPFILTSPDGITWTERASPITGVGAFLSVTYGNGLFVIAGTSCIVSSPDGITWTTRYGLSPSTPDKYFYGVAYGKGSFVAVGFDFGNDNLIILSSPDGATWTKRTSPSGGSLSGITFGNDTFVAVGGAGGALVLTSPDGITWTAQTSPHPLRLNGITYGNGIFMAVGGTQSPSILTSSDGATWTVGTPPAKPRGVSYEWLNGVAYGNGVYVAVGGGNQYTCVSFMSPDGITWSRNESKYPGSPLSGVAYGSGTFVALGGSLVLTSSDGTAWNQTTIPITTTAELNGVGYGNGMFVAVGGSGNTPWNGIPLILTSPDGVIWTERTLPAGTNTELLGVAYGNDTFVAVGGHTSSRYSPMTYTPVVFTSQDGITWNQVTLSITTTAGILDVAYGNGIFVAVGNNSSGDAPFILTSPDGIIWTQRELPPPLIPEVRFEQLSGVTYGNGIFVVVGHEYYLVNFPTVLTSTDGVTWVHSEGPYETWGEWLKAYLFGITYSDGIFVAVGEKTAMRSVPIPIIVTSTDGAIWTERVSPGVEFGLNKVVYGNSTFVAVGGVGNEYGRIVQSSLGRRSLTVTASSKTGTVSSIPSGITCGSACSTVFTDNTEITLTATPSPGYTFVHWSGGCAGPSNPCKLTIEADTIVTAVFSKPVKLTVSKRKLNGGDGVITSDVGAINCGSTCQGSFSPEATVVLSATPGPVSTFTGWTPSSICTGTGTCTVTTSKAKSVNATFVGPYALKVTKVSKRGGSGTVTSSPAGIDCGADCKEAFELNSMVTLTANPAENSSFAGWSPKSICTGTGPCEITMKAARTVTATFTGSSTDAGQAQQEDRAD